MSLDTYNLLQVSQELVTLRDYLRWACSRFNAANLYYGHGTDNAWDEACHLVLSAVHLSPEIPPEMLNAHLTHVERQEICQLIVRRIKERIPAAYLTKEAWFAGIPFYVDERVIIPRSPISELIETGFEPWLNNQPVHHILDLCTGSGCIAIACALAFPESQVDAVDISKKALEVAKINVEKYHVGDQVKLLQTDLFQGISQKYNLIISNPPYVSSEEYAQLPAEYHHEPTHALKAMDGGIEIVQKILENAAHYLYPQGLLIVEVGNAQDALMERYPKAPFLWLDFERGGEGVFVLTAEQLAHFNL